MHVTQAIPGVTAVATGTPVATSMGPNSYRGLAQINVTGTITVALYGSLDGVNWIKLTADLTASSAVETPAYSFLRLQSTAGTGTATGILKEVC